MPEEHETHRSAAQQRLGRVLTGPAPLTPSTRRSEPAPAGVLTGPLQAAAGGGPAGVLDGVLDDRPDNRPDNGPDNDGLDAADMPAAGGVPAAGDVPADSGLARLAGAGAFDPGRRGVRALAALAVTVVLVAAVVAWWSRPRPEPVVPRLAATAAAPASTAPSEPAELVVAVSGLVHEPGLVRLPPGSRVADALDAAGGPLPEADLDHLNLARKVADGELIAVGIPPPPGDPGVSGAGDQTGPGAKVDLNTATQAELESLPGIGPALSQRIIDYRTEHGPFGAVGELRQVSGIGEVRFAELRDLVTV